MQRWTLLVAGLLGLTGLAACDGSGEPYTPFPPAGTDVRHQVSVGVGARTEATLDVVSGVDAVVVRTGTAGYVRAETTAGAQVTPVVTADDRSVRVGLASTAGTAPAGPVTLTVELGAPVRWTVRLSGGARAATLDLAGVRLGGVDLPAGISRIEATLPRPDGVVPVRMAGGATDLLLHLPAGVPYGLQVLGGAASVDVDGVRRTGLGGGTVVTASTAADRYQVDAVAGVSSVVLDRV